MHFMHIFFTRFCDHEIKHSRPEQNKQNNSRTKQRQYKISSARGREFDTLWKMGDVTNSGAK